MTNRGTRGAYRKEDRVSLPPGLQKELVEKAAARYGNCQELAKHLNIPKSSVHYYRVGRLTMPVSVLEQMLRIAGDADLEERVRKAGIEKDRTWANEYAVSVYREMCRERLHLPTREELEKNDDLRRKAAAIISYVMAEGSVWLQKEKWGECAVNITLASHETDLYEHFRSLCRDVFRYDIGPPQKPGNGALAIRGFIYSRFIAEWLIENGVHPGDKSDYDIRLPRWVMESADARTWIAAIQPWCDGEGGVQRSSFILTQSRHTCIDTSLLPNGLLTAGSRHLSKGRLLDGVSTGASLVDYCSAKCRSTVLDDVALLCRRIGLEPRLDFCRLSLKDDDFWSVVWSMRFNARDRRKLTCLGLVIGARKVGQMKGQQ